LLPEEISRNVPSIVAAGRKVLGDNSNMFTWAARQSNVPLANTDRDAAGGQRDKEGSSHNVLQAASNGKKVWV
jgi:hypothetical protein